jgi:hypothetical protein
MQKIKLLQFNTFLIYRFFSYRKFIRYKFYDNLQLMFLIYFNVSIINTGVMFTN